MPDARPLAGDVQVFSRSVSPGSVDLIPTNMRFTVVYNLSAEPGATLDWLGDLTLTEAHQGDLPVDVVRLPSPSYEARFQVTPRAPLPVNGYVILSDRFAIIPCGEYDVCTRVEPGLIAAYKVGATADVTGPRLVSRSISFSSWQRYSYTETCMDTTCSGLEASIHLPAASDEGRVTYRFRYPDGTVVDSENPVIFERLACTRCFQPWPQPPDRPLQLGPIEMTALDWLGQESEGRIVVTLSQPDCDTTTYPDAGPDPVDPPAADASTPSADATPGRAGPDAGVGQAGDGQPDDHGGAGCAVAGSHGSGGWLALAGALLFLRRRRGSALNRAATGFAPAARADAGRRAAAPRRR